MRSLLVGFVAILLVASVFGTAIRTGVSVEDESLSGESVAEEEDSEDRDFDVSEEAFFEITIDDYDEEIIEGYEQVVQYTVNNTGEGTATKDIEFAVYDAYDLGGDEVYTDVEENVELEGGQNHVGTFNWMLGEPGNYSFEVSSDDDSEFRNFDVLEAPNLNFVTEDWYIDGDDIEPVEGFELEEGDTLTFEGQIRNDGGAPIFDALFEYEFPDGSGGSEYIDLEKDETVYVSAYWHVRVVEEPEISIWVNSTADDERTHDEIRYYEDDFEDIEPTEIRFEDLGYPEQEMIPGDSYHFGGRVVRDADDKPLADIEVTISLQSSPALISETVSTDENGEFGVFLTIPDGASGEYTVEFEAHTHEVQSTRESVTVEEDDEIIDRIRDIPGFTSIILLLGMIFAVALYRKKYKRT